MATEHPPIGRPPRVQALRVGVAVLLLAALSALYLSGAVPSAKEVRDFGDGLGPAAPLLWPPLFGLANFLIPWPILAGATGLLFGTAAGTVIALAGVLAAAALQFLTARYVAGPNLRRRVRERLPRVDAALADRGTVAILLSRIVPGVSWGFVNYAAGLSRITLRALWLGTLLGGGPKVFAYVALGGSFGDLSAPEAKVAIGVMVVMAIAGSVLARREYGAMRSR